MSLYQYIDTDHKPYSVDDPAIDKQETNLDAVIDEIFSVDPATGFPRGDIAYYLSKDGNPTIKDWLERNLMRPRAVNTGHVGMDEDMIEEFSRRPDESVEDYAARLASLRDEAIRNENESRLVQTD